MDIASLFTQRMRLTPAEQQAEALLSLENRQRYFEQSARALERPRAAAANEDRPPLAACGPVAIKA